MRRFTIFYAGQIYDEYDNPRDVHQAHLPDGVYIYCRDATGTPGDANWLLKDLTPVLLEDVPKELRMYVLILS